MQYKLLFLFSGLAISNAALVTAQSVPCKEVIAYYPNWQWYNRSKLVKPSTIDYSKYSIINYCFFKPEVTGLISSTDAYADEILLRGEINYTTTPHSYHPNTSLVDLAHKSGTKVMASIGGWTLSDNFPIIAASAALRAKFAHDCNRLLQLYKLDGIDIDWEYPGHLGNAGTPGGGASDKPNFTLFLKQIRDSLNALEVRSGRKYKLSACFSANPSHASNIEWNNVTTILDMINLMTYDFYVGADAVANHNSALMTAAQGNETFNVQAAFKMLTQTYHVPASKINIGVAFYGHSQTGATALYKSTSGKANTTLFANHSGSPQYFELMDKIGFFNYNWDNSAQVPYLFGKTDESASGTFVSYDNPKSVALKAKYVINNNARGVIIWDISGDYMETTSGSGKISGTPLVDTLNKVFCRGAY